MKKVIILIIAVMLLSAGYVFAQEMKTIKGEVIDVSCYVAAGAKGESHKECALACLRAGEPGGILEENTGKVYLVVTEDHTTNPTTKLLPYVAQMVEAKGSVNERAGISTIDIKEIKELSETQGVMTEEKK